MANVDAIDCARRSEKSTVRFARGLILAVVLTLTPACFGTTHLYYSYASMQNDDRLKVVSGTHNWFWGLKDGKSAIMGAACGTKGVATIAVEHTIGDWAWWIFTLGIFAPATVTFTCQ